MLVSSKNSVFWTLTGVPSQSWSWTQNTDSDKCTNTYLNDCFMTTSQNPTGCCCLTVRSPRQNQSYCERRSWTEDSGTIKNSNWSGFVHSTSCELVLLQMRGQTTVHGLGVWGKVQLGTSTTGEKYVEENHSWGQVQSGMCTVRIKYF